MRNSIKKLGVIVISLAIMTTIGGCGGSTQTTTAASKAAVTTQGTTKAATTAAAAKETSSAATTKSTAAAAQNIKPSGKQLNVGVQSNIISVPVVYAYQKGYFKDLGLDVNLVIFPNGSPENEGLAAAQLDVASNGLASVYSMASGLCDWIGETDCGSNTVGIFVKGDSPVLQHKGEKSGKPDMYGSADTLKGLTALGPTSTIEQWVATAYFNQFGLKAGEYNYLNMDRAAAAQAVIGGQGDIFVASDVDYSNMMSKAGFKSVGNCLDATDTVFNNGYLARKDILKERYNDVVLFLKGAYKAAEELQADPDTRNAFTLKYYNDNGKTSTADDVSKETKLRPFILAKDMTASSYEMGSGMLQVGSFFSSIETIEKDQVKSIQAAINVKPLKDALGIDVKGATLK
jgi:ABC-type nitrate/sulfonate/bicarbonate transport system substrate-binding protein